MTVALIVVGCIFGYLAIGVLFVLVWSIIDRITGEPEYEFNDDSRNAIYLTVAFWPFFLVIILVRVPFQIARKIAYAINGEKE